MRYQKVKMVVEFDVPVGRDAYGPRQMELPWREYAEHDMLKQLKEYDPVSLFDRHVYASNVQFEWGPEFEKKADWEE